MNAAFRKSIAESLGISEEDQAILERRGGRSAMSDRCNERCRWPNCRKPTAMTYIDRRLCSEHWRKLAQADDDTIVEAAILRALGLERNGGSVCTTHK